jgi:hypothetical protein
VISSPSSSSCRTTSSQSNNRRSTRVTHRCLWRTSLGQTVHCQPHVYALPP